MYNNFRFKSRDSIRGKYGSRPARPYFRSNSGPSRFSGSRGGARRSQLEGADINMFIKKAAPVIQDQETLTSTSFDTYNLSQELKTNIKDHGYTTATPIQAQVIEPILQGRDVIGLASTGTGKTAAFLIPIIQKIYTDRNQKALIIVPTRELALQINEEFRSLTRNMKLYSAFIIGGTNMYRQIQDLRRNPHIVVATPGRLKDLIERKAIFLADYANIVLDEVDLMVDIGFVADVKYFISQMPKVRQSLFFSATISPKIQEILQAFVNNPVTKIGRASCRERV